MKFFVLFISFMIYLIAWNAHSDESHLYDFLWLDPDKSVYVLQNKAFKKDGSFYVNVGFIKGLSSKYQSTSGFQFKGGYYITEEWAAEFSYNKYNHSNNTTYDNLQRINGSEPFIRRINLSYSLFAMWSPFYGKINTFNKIYYFDWSFGLGVSKLFAESNIDSVTDPNIMSYYSKEQYTAISQKTELRFYINKRYHIGLELMNSHYKAPSALNKGQTNLKSNTDAMLFIGFSF